MTPPKTDVLGRTTIIHGANRLEDQYAEYWQGQGVRLGRKRYFTGRHFKSVGSGGDYSGSHQPPKRPNMSKPYDPERHVRIIWAGGRRRHLGVAA